MCVKHIVSLLLLLTILLPSSPVQAAGTVGVCDEAHLRAALTGGGTVTFGCRGTILLASPIRIASNTTLNGAGQHVILSGRGAVRVFVVNPNVTFILNDLTIADGRAADESGGGILNDGGAVIVSNSTLSGNDADQHGGGIFNRGGSLTVTNSTLSGNSAHGGWGGGIRNENGSLTVTNSIFSGNSASDGGGGGISNTGVAVTVTGSSFSANSASAGGGINNSGGLLIVTNSTFAGNIAINLGGGFGGGIRNYAGGSATIADSVFTANRAANGGGIFNTGGLTVTGSNFTGNRADDQGGWGDSGWGGGIYNYDSAITVSHSTFDGNNAFADGGGLYTYDGAATVSSSTFVRNHADANGGGVCNNGLQGVLSASNSTFADNNAAAGGGIYNSNGGAVTVTNCTLSGNSADVGGSLFDGSGAATLRNTLVVAAAAGSGCFGSISDGGGNLSYPDATCPGVNLDPQLGPLQNNGGRTETMALLAGSAALDAANDATCAAPPVNHLDQRGVIRPQGAHCDIGAHEVTVDTPPPTGRSLFFPIIPR